VGAIDLLAALLDLTDEQRATLRQWYERHAAYVRVLAVHEPFLEVMNLLNDHPYTLRNTTTATHFGGHSGRIAPPRIGKNSQPFLCQSL
jgi:hypothetical protein